jgi:hypothetical protein
MLKTATDFVAWGLLVTPLVILAAVSLMRFIQKRENNRHERYLRFQTLLVTIANKDLDVGPKLAAAYELRRYPDYASVLNKIFVDGNVRQEGSEYLARQLRDTLKTMRPE